MAKHALILPNNTTPFNACQQIEQGLMPRIDYIDLQKAIGGEIIDQSIYQHGLMHLMEYPERTMRLRWGQAFHAIRNWKDYDLVYSLSEDVGVPMAIMQRLFNRKVRHVVVVHSVLSLQKTSIYRLLGAMPIFSKIVALTKATADQIVEKYKLDPGQVTSILDGVDEKFWKPQPQIPVDQQLVVSLGQARRDYDTLIQAVNGLSLQLHIQASSQWYIQYRTQVGDLPYNVSFGSYLPFPRLKELYARANIVVIALKPGAHHSAGSVTIKEAMAMGKAVIVASSGGAEDYIDDGETGIVIPAGNGLALRDAIRDLMADPAMVSRLGKNARNAVETKLSYDRKIRRMAAEANAE